MPKSYESDVSRLHDLSDVCKALVKYGLSLMPGNELSGGYGMWVPYPGNHFAFRVQPRVQNIRFSVRGTPNEFVMFPELQLKWGWGRAYSEFVVSRPDQLYAACSYLKRSYELHQLGRNRFGRAA
jgi:hypothetical protein